MSQMVQKVSQIITKFPKQIWPTQSISSIQIRQKTSQSGKMAFKILYKMLTWHEFDVSSLNASFLSSCCSSPIGREGKPAQPAGAARSTTLLGVTPKMTSAWDACLQTHPAPIWQRRLKEAAAFACTKGIVWSWLIRWCPVKTRPSTPQHTTGRRPASTRHWWGSVWSAGGWLFVWSCSLLVCSACEVTFYSPATLLRSEATIICLTRILLATGNNNNNPLIHANAKSHQMFHHNKFNPTLFFKGTVAASWVQRCPGRLWLTQTSQRVSPLYQNDSACSQTFLQHWHSTVEIHQALQDWTTKSLRWIELYQRHAKQSHNINEV